MEHENYPICTTWTKVLFASGKFRQTSLLQIAVVTTPALVQIQKIAELMWNIENYFQTLHTLDVRENDENLGSRGNKTP